MGRKRKRKGKAAEKANPNIIPFADLLKPIPFMPQKGEVIRQSDSREKLT